MTRHALDPFVGFVNGCAGRIVSLALALGALATIVGVFCVESGDTRGYPGDVQTVGVVGLALLGLAMIGGMVVVVSTTTTARVDSRGGASSTMTAWGEERRSMLLRPLALLALVAVLSGCSARSAALGLAAGAVTTAAGLAASERTTNTSSLPSDGDVLAAVGIGMLVVAGVGGLVGVVQRAAADNPENIDTTETVPAHLLGPTL